MMLKFFKTLPFELKIALRYILPRRNHAFSSLISIFSFLGILIGVWALIIVMSVMNGFRAELLDRILGVNGHILIEPYPSLEHEYPDYLKRLVALGGVKSATPLVEQPILVQNFDTHQSTGAIMRGIQVKDLKQQKIISSNIVAGSLASLEAADRIGIGTGLATRFGVSVGDKLQLLSPEGDASPFGTLPRMKVYTVGFIYEIGMSEFDNAFLFVNLAESQAFLNLGQKISSIEVFLNSADDVDVLLPQVSAIVGDQGAIIDWRQRNQSFFSALTIERNVMFIILTLIILVAALNIISGLVMLVRDKTADIAILRTMGASRQSILRIFLFIGLTIGLSGTFIGVVLAIVTCYYIEPLQRFFGWLFNVDLFNSQLYFLNHLPAQLNWGEVVAVILMTLILSFLATLIPAARASRLDPVKALRSE